MSVASDSVKELVALSARAFTKGKEVTGLIGDSTEGKELMELLTKIQSVAFTLNRERVTDLFLAPSIARERDQVAYLEARLRASELQRRSKGDQMDFLPGQAYNAGAVPARVTTLLRKLEAVDENTDYSGVPVLHLSRVRELGDDLLRALQGLLVYLQPSVSLPDRKTADTIGNILLGIAKNGRAFTECCRDADEKARMLGGVEGLESAGDRLVAGIRNNDPDTELFRHDCLRQCGEFVANMAPSSLKNVMSAPPADAKVSAHRLTDSQNSGTDYYSSSLVESSDV